MTDEQKQRVSGARSFLLEEGKKRLATVFWAFLAGLVLWALTPLKDVAADLLDLPERVEELAGKVDAIAEKQAELAGENRVIRERPEAYYVEEPVFQGEDIVLNLLVARTEAGKDCVLKDFVPLFRGPAGAVERGHRADDNVIRQVAEGEFVPIKLKLTPPPSLRPGTIRVHLYLQYEGLSAVCTTDTTAPVAYRLEAGKRPEVSK